MKFCHRRLIPLQNVSERLLKKYNSARKVDDRDFYNVSQISYNKGGAPQNGGVQNKGGVQNEGGIRNDFYALSKTHEDEMLYLDDDVNYCSTNKGQYSSTGRRCSLNDTRTDSCNKICCGKGYREQKIEVHTKCRCKFVYCCRVECDTCKRFDKIHECM